MNIEETFVQVKEDMYVSIYTKQQNKLNEIDKIDQFYPT